MKNLIDVDRNLTISFDQRVRPYHTRIAALLDAELDRDACLLLDVGCGVGNTLSEIAKLRPNCRFVVADPDPRCLALTKDRVTVKQELLIRDSADFESLDEVFDCVVISHTLHYDSDPVALIRRLIALLRTGGCILVASPNPCTPTKLVASALGRNRSEGLYAWDRATLVNFIGMFPELSIREVAPDFVPLPLVASSRMFSPLMRALARLLPGWAFSTIVVARKVA